MIRQTFVLALATLGIPCLGGANLEASDFVTVVGWDRQLFPSYIIASASPKSDISEEEDDEDSIPVIGDKDGIIGIEIESPSDNAQIEVTISADDWLSASTISAELPVKGEVYRLMPALKYKYADLARNRQTTPTTVSYRVVLDGVEMPERNETMVLHSINDCPYALRDEEGFTRIGYVYAAYVNEQHPFVDKILREALDSNIVDSFTGYQHKSDAEVLRQVYSVWHALSERDLRYSNITTVAGESETVYSQHVRLIDESINNGQANCVDGSVLMASILRKIDIEPILVMVPGHCFLAFSLDPKGDKIVALETTMIGGGATEDFESIELLDELLDDEVRQQESYASFCNAMHTGCERLVADSAKFDSEEETSYQLIPIAAARKRGVLPIAFQQGQEFQALE